MNSSDPREIIVRQMGLREYPGIWRRMQSFTAAREAGTTDELWLLEHHPVFTQGLNGKSLHLRNTGDIPVVAVDRGGQVTYHGPGQLIAYVLLDLTRRKLGVKQLVQDLEQSVIALLSEYGIQARGDRKAPGVYIDDRKLASLGLRVRHGRCYHGLSLNVDMDLSPFTRINPCGYADMQVTQLRDEGVRESMLQVSDRLQSHLLEILGYTRACYHNEYRHVTAC